jgi:heme o synthase
MTAAVAKAVDLVSLVKPRIMIMALLTAAGAASLAPGTIAVADALWLLAGTALIVGSANTLNMWLERDVDCLMTRTKDRALPQRRLDANTALVFGALQGAIAIPVMAKAGLITAALGVLALVLYVGVYTPMKQRSYFAVWVGAVPGAMPALMGWTAATGRIDIAGLAVFSVLFIWQIPHFHAIAMYRQRDYDAAGLKTFPSTFGIPAARRAIGLYLVVQVIASLTLVPLGVAGWIYGVTALVLGVVVLAQGLPGVRGGEARWARSVFLYSIVYLPVLFAVMVFDGRS